MSTETTRPIRESDFLVFSADTMFFGLYNMTPEADSVSKYIIMVLNVHRNHKAY